MTTNSFKKIIISIQVLLVLSGINSFAQTTSPAKSLLVIMKVNPGDTTMSPGDTAFKSNTVLNAKAIVLLNDTNNVYKIHLKIGTTDSTGDLLTKTFIYGQQGIFSDGTSYSRVGKALYFGLGNFTGINRYFGDVKLENITNITSSSTKFRNRNGN
jgi:hypothetical protein